MGNTVGAPIVSEYLEDEIGPIVCQNSLGNASRFLKTVKAFHDEEGYVVVKIYKKRTTRDNLDKYQHTLKENKEAFNVTNTTYTSYNIMPYQNFLETERSGYLIRQYFHNNLYDRISTRPFLSMIEKKFIAFQLLEALKQIFFKGITHGDIKSENVMVTTNNWVYLTDFASYKPTFIPEDNPSDFSFYFDTSGRRTCYIAPERFYETNKGMPVGDLTPKMDIFSLGCVIAEIFLEGVPIFDFSQLLSYRKGEYSPDAVIKRIPDQHIQSLILHMIQKEPEARYSPEKYLMIWKNKAFPAYFDFAHQFISELMKLDNDDRIMCLSDNFHEIIQIFSNNTISSPTISSPNLQSSIKQQLPQQPLSLNGTGRDSSSSLISDSDDLNNNNNNKNNNDKNNISNIIFKAETFIKDQEKFENIDLNNFKLEDLNIKKEISITNTPKPTTTTTNLVNDQISKLDNTTTTVTTGIVEGLDIFLSLIYSALKFSKYPHTKVKGISGLLERFALYLDDECKLQKIVPYLMSMIFSSTKPVLVQPSLVRVEALRSLAKVLEMVQNFPPSESAIFSQYILPSLSQLSLDSTEEIVRIAYAEVLPQLATTAKRFLEIAQRYRDPDVQHQRSARQDRSKYKVYDSDLNEIQDLFLTKVSDLLTKDSCITLKRIILSDIYRLCVFFGRQKTNESVLPLIITFLNDKDWQLRCAFFENIVAVCTVVGAGSLESFIYPCILLALADEEEFVTEKALASLTELCSLGLLRKNILLELLIKTSPMLLHPNNWIRYGVISLIIKICSSLSKADLHCYAKPKLSIFLQGEISDNINENNLFHLLEAPISRESFNKIVKVIYKNQISLSAALHSNANGLNDNNNMNSTSPQMLNLGTGGSYRRLRALSQKLYPVNGSLGSSPSSSSGGQQVISLNHMDEHQQNFLNQMNELKIPSEDQEKIFKCLDYLLLKKYKDDDLLSSSMNSGQTPITVTSNNNIIRQSIAKSNNINPSTSSQSPVNLQSNIEITKLPTSTPLRVSKMRSVDSNSASINSSLNTLPTTMSSSTTSLPQLSINQMNNSLQNMSATLSTSNPIITNSSSNLNQLATNNNPNNNNPNNNNINSNNNNSNNPNNQSFNNQSPNSIDNLNVNQLELNVTTKKYTILSKQANNNLKDILKVDIQSDCFIYTAPPLPDMGVSDNSGYFGNIVNNTVIGNTTVNSNNMNSPLLSTINESSTLPSWRPQGILVSHFFEHKSAINEIQVSSDNLFFATASNDGTVKIWDCQRMEKSVTNKSRQTYQQDGGRITSISICEKTHSIASASDRGSIHIFRVGMGGKQKSGNLKYNGFSTIKNINESEGNIVGVEHYSTNSASIVTYATSKSGIKGWDLRSQQQAFSLLNEASLGLIQALLIDPNRNWFVTATSRGFITCWDLRFKIPLYNHRVTNGRIFKMIPYLGGLRSSIETSWIYISTEMDNVILFDLASKSTKRIFKRSFNDSAPTNLHNQSSSNNTSLSTPNNSTFTSNTPISLTPNSSSQQLNNPMLGSIHQSTYDFATENLRPIPKTTILPTPNIQNLNITPLVGTPSSSGSAVVNSNTPITTIEKKSPIIRALLSPMNCSYLITAGDDKRIKFWEGKNIIDSYYISNGKEPPPPFTHKYSNNPSIGLETFEEVWCDPNVSSFYPNSIQSSISNIQSKQKQKSPISTPTIHHQEPILDLKVMEVPHPMLISCSTDGIVKVWK